MALTAKNIEEMLENFTCPITLEEFPFDGVYIKNHPIKEARFRTISKRALDKIIETNNKMYICPFTNIKIENPIPSDAIQYLMVLFVVAALSYQDFQNVNPEKRMEIIKKFNSIKDTEDYETAIEVWNEAEISMNNTDNYINKYKNAPLNFIVDLSKLEQNSLDNLFMTKTKKNELLIKLNDEIKKINNEINEITIDEFDLLIYTLKKIKQDYLESHDVKSVGYLIWILNCISSDYIKKNKPLNEFDKILKGDLQNKIFTQIYNLFLYNSYYNKDRNTKHDAFLLGVLFYFGFGTAQDYKMAADFFKKSVSQNYYPAMNFLGVLYEKGQGVEKDLKKGFHLIKLAAMSGCAIGLYNLGFSHYYGNNANKSEVVGLKYLEESAQKSFPPAMRLLEKIKTEAIPRPNEELLVEREGLRNSPLSMGDERANKLSSCSTEKNPFVEQEVLQNQFFENLDDEYIATYAFNNLIKDYSVNHIENQLYEDLLYSYTIITRGNSSWSKKFQNQDKGCLRELFQGVNNKLTNEYKMQKSRNMKELYFLGLLFYFGLGTSKNTKRAVELFNESTSNGYIPATSFLGTCYQKGHGVEKNLKKGFHIIELAAKSGCAISLYNLGYSYYHGENAEKDKTLGLKYIKESAKKNFPLAIRFCKKLENKITAVEMEIDKDNSILNQYKMSENPYKIKANKASMRSPDQIAVMDEKPDLDEFSKYVEEQGNLLKNFQNKS